MKYSFLVSVLMCVCFLCDGHDIPLYVPNPDGYNLRLSAHYDSTSLDGSPHHRHHICYYFMKDGIEVEAEFQDVFPIEASRVKVPPPNIVDPPVTEPSVVTPPVPIVAPEVPPPIVVETTPDPVSEPITGTPIESGVSVVEAHAMDTQQGISAPPVPVAVVEKPKAPPANIVLTQVMFHDWGALGGRNQPQWFELHNRGGDANLEGYTLRFQVRTKHFGIYEEKVIVLKDFQLPAGETMIVTRRRVGHFVGHLWGDTQGVAYIYIDEAIPNLKNRWVLTDSEGKELYRRDARWNWGWGPHENRERKAFDVVPSEVYTGEDKRYYGSCFDRGNPPGWHVDLSPQAPQLLRKRIGTWGALKRQN